MFKRKNKNKRILGRGDFILKLIEIISKVDGASKTSLNANEIYACFCGWDSSLIIEDNVTVMRLTLQDFIAYFLTVTKDSYLLHEQKGLFQKSSNFVGVFCHCAEGSNDSIESFDLIESLDKRMILFAGFEENDIFSISHIGIYIPSAPKDTTLLIPNKNGIKKEDFEKMLNKFPDLIEYVVQDTNLNLGPELSATIDFNRQFFAVTSKKIQDIPFIIRYLP